MTPSGSSKHARQYNTGRTHYGLSEVADPKSQAPKQEQRKIPADKVRLMMVAESKATAYSPKNKCERCGYWFIHKFLVMIEPPAGPGSFLKDKVYVCRICYNKCTDRKVGNRK